MFIIIINSGATIINIIYIKDLEDDYYYNIIIYLLLLIYNNSHIINSWVLLGIAFFILRLLGPGILVL